MVTFHAVDLEILQDRAETACLPCRLGIFQSMKV